MTTTKFRMCVILVPIAVAVIASILGEWGVWRNEAPPQAKPAPSAPEDVAELLRRGNDSYPSGKIDEAIRAKLL